MKKHAARTAKLPLRSARRKQARPVKGVIHKMGISEQSFYRWKKLYGGLGPSYVCPLKQLVTYLSLAIEVAWRLGGHGVVATLMQVAEEKGLPKSIRIDNWPEFTSKVSDQWACLNGVELDFIRPGKPADNGLIEAFNGRFREECLNESWFLSLEDARYSHRFHQKHKRTFKRLL